MPPRSQPTSLKSPVKGKAKRKGKAAADADSTVTVNLDASSSVGDLTSPGLSDGSAMGSTKRKAKNYEQEQWELRMVQSRRWGHTLIDTGGSDSNSVRQLTRTLKDARSASQVALRRTAVEALVPAAAQGVRGAVLAQAKALVDDNATVRDTAFRSLRQAAGGHRAKQGGAVAVSLMDTLPSASKLENVEARRAAANALARLAPAGDAATTKLAISWLDDSDPWVRCHATRALSLVDPSKHQAVAAVAARVSDSDWRVSREAIGALERVAQERKAQQSQRPESGASEASSSSRRETVKSSKKGKDINPAKSLAESCSGEICSLRGLPRSAAVAALGRAANPGDGFAIEAAAARLEDVDVDVRNEAVSALAKLGAGDREKSLKAAARQLTHSDFRVRDIAGRAMAEVSEAGDGTACKVAAAALDQQDWAGRRGVAGALRRLGQQGDGAGRKSVFAVLVPRLEHPDWSIRRKAAQALGEVAKGTGDPRAMKLLLGMTKDPDDEVRSAVAAALPGAAPKRSREAIIIAAQFTQDTEIGIRLSALGAIKELASETRSRSRLAVYAVAKCFEDPEEQVRQVAVRVMISIAKGRRTSIDILAELLEREEPHVRECAIAAFSGVAPANRDRALKRTVPLLRHEEDYVREAATAAMCGMSKTEAAEREAAKKKAERKAQMKTQKKQKPQTAAQKRAAEREIAEKEAAEKEAAEKEAAEKEAAAKEAAEREATETEAEDRETTEREFSEAPEKEEEAAESDDEQISAAPAVAAQIEEAAVLAAAAATVARFRRRFQAPAGHALWEEQSFFTEGSSRPASSTDKVADLPEGAPVVSEPVTQARGSKPGMPASRAPSMPGSKAPSMAQSKAPSVAPSMPISLKSSSKTGAQAMAQALLAGDIGVAAQLAEERRRQEEELTEDHSSAEANDDTSEEEELSESSTDDDMAKAPTRLNVAGATGGNASTINGIYHISEESYNGKPQWQKADDPDKWLCVLDGQWFITSQSFKWMQRKDGFVQSNPADVLPMQVSQWKVKQMTGIWEVQPLEVFKDPPPDRKPSDGAADAKPFAGNRRTSAERNSGSKEPGSSSATRKSGAQQEQHRGSVQAR